MNLLKSIYRKLPNKVKRIIKRVIKRKENNKNILTKEKLLKQLLKYDVISFDIFDTLITRTIFEPDDIFKLMEEKLVDIKLKDSMLVMRKTAERKAIEKLHKDVNIDEIYFELADIYGYDEETINKIKGLEVDLEYHLTRPRRDMLDILKTLVQHKKKVVLTSDMYLNRHIIKRMLELCGYNEGEHYNKIYLSNEKNKRKDSGTMWKYIKILYTGIKFIHVGDNIESDYNIPISYGLKAISIDNPREQIKKHEYGKGINQYIENRSISDSLFLGYIINDQIFNSPFSYNINTMEVFAKTFVSPILYELVKFIDERSNKNDKLLFLAREGYYLEKIYAEYCKVFSKEEKNHYYFLTSRRSTISATIFNEEDIKKTVNKEYTGTMKKFMEGIFSIDYNDADFDIVLPRDYDKVVDIVLEYANDIINQTKKNQMSYMAYIDSLFDYKKENLLLIDLGYSGTIQYHLTKMLKKEIKGVYLTNSSTVKKYSDKSELEFLFDINDDRAYEKIYHYSLILEYFLSAPYGQLQYFEMKKDKAVPIYNDEIMDKSKEKNIETIYNSLVGYLGDMKLLNDIYHLDISKELLCASYTAIIESNIVSRIIKDKFDYLDSFNDSETRNIFKVISRY